MPREEKEIEPMMNPIAACLLDCQNRLEMGFELTNLGSGLMYRIASERGRVRQVLQSEYDYQKMLWERCLRGMVALCKSELSIGPEVSLEREKSKR